MSSSGTSSAAQSRPPLICPPPDYPPLKRPPLHKILLHWFVLRWQHTTKMALSDANLTQIRNEARALIQEERTAAAVSVKLPPFWPEKARFWFTIVEANFVTG